MEKWRIYLAMAAVVMALYNLQNIDKNDFFSNPYGVAGFLSSILLLIALLLFKSKKK